MAKRQLRMSFTDLAALERELASNLSQGRAFLAQAEDVQVLSDCLLVLVHPVHGAELQLPAQVVMVSASGPVRGTGLQLRPFGPPVLEQLERFAHAAADSTAATATRGPAWDDEASLAAQRALAAQIEADLAADEARRAAAHAPEAQRPPNAAVAREPSATGTATDRGAEAAAARDSEALGEPAAADTAAHDARATPDLHADADAELDATDPEAASPDATDPDATDPADPADPADPDYAADTSATDLELEQELQRELGGKSIPPDVQLQKKQEKLRKLKPAEQLKLARTGELADRLTIERLYGKQVWEALLHNPRLTIPEVARIARKGTVPKPLLEVILENAGWIKAPQVRRALLANPKIGLDAIGKLLRGTPKHELKLIEKGTAYAMPVREAARKLLKQ